MSSPCMLYLSASRIPEWLETALNVVFLGLAFAAFGWGFVLDQRYTGPYTLKVASATQKWRRAVIVMFWQTMPFPLMGWIGSLKNGA